MGRTSVLAVAAAALAAVASAQPYAQITNLPGWSNTQNWSMYSGYITVNATAGRSLFFWFVESANNPKTDPLVAWTNGGPGCSSLGGGLFEEHGPFYPDATGTNLVANPWSWNNAANMLYLEQPAGVGFSYSNTTSDYTVGDARSAADFYTFLQVWLSQPTFSAFRSNPLYISGESYGGHYVPATTAYIIAQNGVNKQYPPLNLAGLVVGNAWTDAPLDNTGAVEMWYWHNMIDNDTRSGILTTCNMSDVGPLMRGSRVVDATETVSGHFLAPGAMGFKSRRPVLAADGSAALPTAAGMSCDDYQNQAFAQMGNTDIYNVYSNVCVSGDGSARSSGSRHGRKFRGHAADVKKAAMAVTARTGASAPPVDSNVPAGCAADYNPCIDTPVATYLNRADVQAAISVMPATIPGGSWVGCSNLVNYSFNDLLSSMLPTYNYMLTAFPTGRYLVFSGDVDGIVPFTGTRFWLQALGWPVTTAFHPYNTPDQQVAGWSYTLTAPSGGNLTFASVRNAGHLVPTFQGSRGLQLFSTWITGGNP